MISLIDINIKTQKNIKIIHIVMDKNIAKVKLIRSNKKKLKTVFFCCFWFNGLSSLNRTQHVMSPTSQKATDLWGQNHIVAVTQRSPECLKDTPRKTADRLDRKQLPASGSQQCEVGCISHAVTHSDVFSQCGGVLSAPSRCNPSRLVWFWHQRRLSVSLVILLHAA